ncbi:MAG: hypothetical protein M9900_02930 [Flavobacteriales bacterium]|nr:hypothetical protein [Flavobacteriales bacterium]
MSWDVVVFNLKRKVASVEEIDESVLAEIGTYADFEAMLKRRFPMLTNEDGWLKADLDVCCLETGLGELHETFSNTIFHLYGENAVYELIELCKANNWQAFDTALGQMLDLDHPEQNGYKEHRHYVEQIMNKRL